ncbi:MAG: carbohydrate ABC transporter permease, partial [Christensenellales bacterium]
MAPLLYLPEASQATLQIALAQIQDPRIQNWPLRMAGCVIAMTPLLVMYLISQKYVLKGVSVSAGFKG